MDQYEFIRTAHRSYGKNISELSRITGHSRNTVKKAIRGEAWGYTERKKQAFPVLGPYLSIINEWLRQDKEQPKKQRHTARRIYNRLRNEYEFTGGESTVRRYVQLARLEFGLDPASRAFIPCEPEVGREAEVDWGTATAILGGDTVKLKFFCMRSKFSGKHFVRCYRCERQQAFFDAHTKAFEFFGGIFPVLIYDNLTTAVRKVLQGRGRIEQEGFSRLKAYHNFEARFCNPASGHEKGGVEGQVGFCRRNYMVPVPEAADIEELNAMLLKKCFDYGSHTISGRSESVDSLYAKEKDQLLVPPDAPYSNIQLCEARADKYATVMVDKNRYSVPWRYVGCKLKVTLSVDQVEICFGNKKLAVHNRLFSNNKWSLDPQHYLELIQRRPMAFNSARPIKQWREHWPQSLHQLLACFCSNQGETKGIKDFISVLMLYGRYSADEVETAVEIALEKGLRSSDGVQQILTYTGEEIPSIAPLPNWSSLPKTDLSIYGELEGVQ
ncbi:MAG: IS21 family transposase [Candidatus Methanomethylophilaceae archaeon]|nr:IS21 family transposase [Candidatus Methanomethylophilaceae archaeon]